MSKRTKNQVKRDLDNLHDATIFLGVSLLIFLTVFIPKIQRVQNLNNAGHRQEIVQKSLPLHLLNRADLPSKVYSVNQALEEREKIFGEKIYLEGYIVDKYQCRENVDKDCLETTEDFLVVSDFNQALSDYLIKNALDVNRIIIRSKTVRMPLDLFNSIKNGDKLVFYGEFVDNLVPIGHLPDGESVEGLMLVYDRLALAK